MGYNLKCYKNTFLRVNYTPTCLKIKKHLWANGLKAPALGCVSHEFFPEPPWECKQLRDAGGHLTIQYNTIQYNNLFNHVNV